MSVVTKIDSYLMEGKDFEAAFDYWFKSVQKMINDYMTKEFPGQTKTLEVMKGKRYYKVVAVDGGIGAGRSAWAFIDTTNGDVLKPAGWSAPAKGARGNLFDKDNGLKSVGPYGPAYKRGGNY